MLLDKRNVRRIINEIKPEVEKMISHVVLTELTTAEIRKAILSMDIDEKDFFIKKIKGESGGKSELDELKAKIFGYIKRKRRTFAELAELLGIEDFKLYANRANISPHAKALMELRNTGEVVIRQHNDSTGSQLYLQARTDRF